MQRSEQSALLMPWPCLSCVPARLASPGLCRRWGSGTRPSSSAPPSTKEDGKIEPAIISDHCDEGELEEGGWDGPEMMLPPCLLVSVQTCHCHRCCPAFLPFFSFHLRYLQSATTSLSSATCHRAAELKICANERLGRRTPLSVAHTS